MLASLAHIQFVGVVTMDVELDSDSSKPTHTHSGSDEADVKRIADQDELDGMDQGKDKDGDKDQNSVRDKLAHGPRTIAHRLQVCLALQSRFFGC